MTRWTWVCGLLVALLASLANTAAAGKASLIIAPRLPSCRGYTDWRVPAACPFRRCRDRRYIFDYSHCSLCDTIDDGTPMADFLSCNVCKEGYASIGDRYRRECLSMRRLQCDSYVGSECQQCRKGAVKIKAVRAPATYYRASAGFCTGLWDAADICRTCAQLGCPGTCRDGVGCRRCPAGRLKLQTMPPLGFKTKAWHGYCTGLTPKPFEPVPALPSVCLRPKEDLRCAPGAFKAGVGCTACLSGWAMRPIEAARIAGSNFLQLQVAGQACYPPLNLVRAP